MRGEAGGRAGAEGVQQELAPQKLSLKMLDCYRPARAVADMMTWAQNGKDTPASGATIRRSASGTCSGSAISPPIRSIRPVPRVDLTLVDLKADNSATFDPDKAYADCTAPVDAARAGGQHRHGHRL